MKNVFLVHFPVRWLALTLVFVSVNAIAAEPLTAYGTVLLQPDAVLQKRVPSVQDFRAYVDSVQGGVSGAVAVVGERVPASGFVVVGVKPGGKSHVWLDFNPPLSKKLAAKIVATVNTTNPPEVQQGVALFALKVGLWGAKAASAPLPSPAEWKTAAKKLGRSVEAGEVAEAAWGAAAR